MSDNRDSGDEDEALKSQEEREAYMNAPLALDAEFEEFVAQGSPHVRRGVRVLFYGRDPDQAANSEFSMMKLSAEHRLEYLRRPHEILKEFKRLTGRDGPLKSRAQAEAELLKLDEKLNHPDEDMRINAEVLGEMEAVRPAPPRGVRREG